MTLDPIDHRILTVLQQNADLPNITLAERVGLSASACLRRVARLKEAGVIRRVVALLDPAQTGRPLTAIVTLEFARHGSEFRRAFMEKIKTEPAVTQCYLVTGAVSCVLIVHMRDMDEYLAFADRLFDQDENVEAFYTHIVLQTIKNEPGVPLPAAG
ncbi:AsnC family transcriptional regulator [Bordetella genomosp. 1]|uniref:AsnC family transcriptional regulator n=1 Tax=Bordetella genomosp. 1 TaxID=1395607 RepID=A0A261SHH3_9BORD|nr:Lrp/AsnC family transcriptional regulator [Bordetella genomosp. 1]MDQ8035414.1 Lrp/AsnC family transcriptional regulator [Bordetella sp.]OZI36230.1 AsnC family transcriptional regulator [Bordetella genomosp. 1]OZI58928.1 AsnC family transcriptional regulator [Bordetella genomosp. 1]